MKAVREKTGSVMPVRTSPAVSAVRPGTLSPVSGSVAVNPFMGPAGVVVRSRRISLPFCVSRTLPSMAAPLQGR